MVDSRATTARPLAMASDTCGDILTRLRSCEEKANQDQRKKMDNPFIIERNLVVGFKRGDMILES